MSIAAKLQKEFASKPRSSRATASSLEGGSGLSTQTSVRSFTIRLPPEERARQERESKRKADEEYSRKEPEEPEVEALPSASTTFESDKYMASLWLKQRCSSTASLRIESALKTGQLPRSNSSNNNNAVAKFAAKRNTIVKQCQHCLVLYQPFVSHSCTFSPEALYK